MRISVLQLWVMCITMSMSAILLNAFDGSPIEDRMKYISALGGCALGGTLIGWFNKRNNLV